MSPISEASFGGTPLNVSGTGAVREWSYISLLMSHIGKKTKGMGHPSQVTVCVLGKRTYIPHTITYRLVINVTEQLIIEGETSFICTKYESALLQTVHQLQAQRQKSQIIKFTLRDLVIHTDFVGILCAVSNSGVSRTDIICIYFVSLCLNT